MELPKTWIQTGLNITGHFEDSTDPFGGVTGDFDGMGISVGVLQWNIGSGSLQPLVKKVGRPAVMDKMPVFGDQLWSACNVSIRQGLSVVRGWQNGHRLMPQIRAELKSFTRSEAFVKQQVIAAEGVAKESLQGAVNWNKAAGLGDPNLQEFCWFFDVWTQNGGLKDVSPVHVTSFIEANGTDRADDLICDWLAERTHQDSGFKDSRKNANLWRNAIPDNKLLLFVASFLRSQKSRLKYRADVLNRKGSIALGTGWVHGEKHDFGTIFNAIG